LLSLSFSESCNEFHSMSSRRHLSTSSRTDWKTSGKKDENILLLSSKTQC